MVKELAEECVCPLWVFKKPKPPPPPLWHDAYFPNFNHMIMCGVLGYREIISENQGKSEIEFIPLKVTVNANMFASDVILVDHV